MQQGIQFLFYRGFTQAPDTQDARKDQAAGVGTEARDDFMFPHVIHLSRHPWHGDNDTPIFLNPPARRGAPWIRQRLGRGNQGGLLDVPFRHLRVTRGKYPP